MLLALCLIEAKISCYFPDLAHTHKGWLTPMPSLHFGRLDGGTGSSHMLVQGAQWCVLQEALLAVQQGLPGSRCHLPQRQKVIPRKGRGKGGLCNFNLCHNLQEKPHFSWC